MASKDTYWKRQAIEVQDARSPRRMICTESARPAIDMVNDSPRTRFRRSYHRACTHGGDCVQIRHIPDDGEERTIKSKALRLEIPKVENTDGRTSEDVNIGMTTRVAKSRDIYDG